MASGSRITSTELMLKTVAEGSVKRKKGDREEDKKQEPSHGLINSLLAPEPSGEHFPDDLLEILRSSLPVKVEMLGKQFLNEIDAEDVLSILIKNTEFENEKTTETQVHNKTSIELNGFLYQSLPKPNEDGDGEIALYQFSNSTVENLKSGQPVKVKVLMKIFQEFEFEGVLNLLDEKTELQAGKKKPIRKIPYLVRQNICKLLNVRRTLGNDFRTFAGELGMSTENIKLISSEQDPAEEVLKWFETKATATVQSLLEIFKGMKRDDVVDVLEGNRKSGDKSVLMVRTMAYSVREKICRMLNVRRQPLGGDFRTLAGLVEMSNEDIKLISDKENPADELLFWWETQNSATMEAFQLKLQEMDRCDIVETIEKVDESVLMVRTMAYSVREKICRMLNVRRQPLGGDFRTLAGLVEMSNEDIKLISGKENPADEILSWWEIQNSATMEAFQLKLQEMDRCDIVEVIDKAQINSGNRSDQPHPGIGREKQSISSPVGPDHEQQLLFGRHFNTENWRVRFASENYEIWNSEANNSRESMRVSNLLKMVVLVAVAAAASAAAAVLVVIPGYQWLSST